MNHIKLFKESGVLYNMKVEVVETSTLRRAVDTIHTQIDGPFV